MLVGGRATVLLFLVVCVLISACRTASGASSSPGVPTAVPAAPTRPLFDYRTALEIT